MTSDHANRGEQKAIEYAGIHNVSDRIARLILGSDGFARMPLAQADALLDAYIERGGNAIDTARHYGRGVTEGIIGQWMAKRGVREQIIIVTKGAHHEEETLRRRVTPEDITNDLLRSLDELGVEFIDLLLLHRDDPDVPVDAIVDCLNGHADAGRIHAYGGSNWSCDRLDAANAYAERTGRRPFVASSPNLALAAPTTTPWHESITVSGDATSLAWYRRTRMPLLSWSAQARGFFSGRFAPGQIDDPIVAKFYDNASNWERMRRVRIAAERHNCSPIQIALAWVLRYPIESFALFGPLTVSEMDDSIGAISVALTIEEAEWLNLERDD